MRRDRDLRRQQKMETETDREREREAAVTCDGRLFRRSAAATGNTLQSLTEITAR